MTDYCLGFLLDEDQEHVLLILKEKPEWQRNKFNGVGGKVELHESPREAMARELKEEAGIDFAGWDHYATILTGDCRVYVFRGFDGSIFHAKTMTAEEVVKVPVKNLPNLNVLPNVRWLVEMALCEHQKYSLIPN